MHSVDSFVSNDHSEFSLLLLFKILSDIAVHYGVYYVRYNSFSRFHTTLFYIAKVLKVFSFTLLYYISYSI
ncbi:hypothetical protein BJV82DRAFT_639088, partial [Fennellomyces sp. T-0311]